MKVHELITHLKTLPQDQDVKVKIYGCGFDSWHTVTGDMVIEAKDEADNDIVEITADFN